MALETILAAQFAPVVVDVLMKWLSNRKATAKAAEEVATSPSGSPEAVIEFAKWLSTKLPSTPDSVSGSAIHTLPLEKADEVLGALAISSRISGTSPGTNLKVSPAGKFDLVRPDRRVGLGQTRVGGSPQPILICTSADPFPAWATKDLPAIPSRVVIGQMSAPILRESTGVPQTVPSHEHRPGRSVAHQDYFAGSFRGLCPVAG
jgi:hypothetical protein